MNSHDVFTQEIGALASVRDRIGPEFDQAVDLILSKPGKVVVAGIGKSGIIGHKIAATLASTGTPAVFLNAGEALHGDLGMVGPEDVVLMLSKSGETAELAHMLPSVKEIGAALIGMFGATHTKLAQVCDLVLDVTVDDEACPLSLAPTTSATVSLVMGDALAIALMEKRGFSPDKFAVFHPGGSLGRRLLIQVRDVLPAGETVAGISAGVTLREAIQELSASSRGAVCLLSTQETIEGILTEGDIRRHFLLGTDPDTLVSEVMTPNPKVIPHTARLGEALDLMEKGDRQVYVLPVVDENHHYCGMLRMHDIVT
jgi:arabinose-5-phosphate isomerase